MDPGHRDALATGVDPHGDGVGPVGPDDSVVKAKNPVWIGKLAGDHLLQLLGQLRRQRSIHKGPIGHG
jgi:hypothetical protein